MGGREATMGKRPYPSEFRQQMVELVRAGRSPEKLAEEFEPSAQTIRNWDCQADLDEGKRKDGLTSEEQQELRRAPSGLRAWINRGSPISPTCARGRAGSTWP